MMVMYIKCVWLLTCFLPLLTLGYTVKEEITEPRNIMREHNKEYNENVDWKNCGNINIPVQDKIVGGSIANKDSWPWIAVLGYNRSHSKPLTWLCGGVLITHRHVLTAGHCLHGYTHQLSVVRLGEHDLHLDNETEHHDFEIKQMILHPDYDPYRHSAFVNDIALLVLDRDVIFSDSIYPICLPGKDLKVDSIVGDYASIAGWGSLGYEEATSNILNEVTVRVTNMTYCADAYTEFKSQGVVIDNRVICAIAPGKDACEGDSGGPLTMALGKENEGVKWCIIGVISFGNECARPDYPGVYTRVTHFLPWIKETVKRTLL